MEKFKIYIDRLKNGHVEKFNETVAPEFLDINEEELQFPSPVLVKGEAYLADDHLVAHFSVSTSATIPCSICNNPVSVPLKIDNAYSSIALEDVTSAIYDLTDEIRETTLLQAPLFTECNNGKCPERAVLKEFLNMEESSGHPQEKGPTVHFPFADLN